MKSFNIQPIEKQTLSDGETLDVHSVFYTIQGEGPFAGSPAVFIRLAGCNLQCPMCDTDYTEGRETREVSEIIKTVKELNQAPMKNRPLVVITGGEPMRQEIGTLLRELVKADFHPQIETNGTLFRPGLPWDDITVICSPKAGRISPGLEPHIFGYKYVVHADQIDPQDGLPTLALNHSASPRVARPPKSFIGPVYIQPVDEKDDVANRRHLEAAKTSALKFGHILGLQIHKIINVE